MTSRTLTMPRLGETMEEGTIVGWLVAPGQAFQRGAALLEIETDKTVVEYPALGDGVLEATLAAPGDQVSVGAPIARVTVARAEDWAETPAESLSAEIAAAPVMPHAAPATARRRATPPARRLARKAGVRLETLPGSGRRGRIERHDVERAASARPQGNIAFDRIGDGGATFLLLHGFAGDRSTWVATASGIARAGHSVIVPDLPGHGASAAEAGSLDDLVDAMTDFARSLDGDLHLVGHSLGGAVAAGIADRLGSKVASLTLIAPAGTGREIESAFILGMAEATRAGEVAHLLRLLGPKTEGLSDVVLAAIAEQLARGRLKTLAQALVGPQGQKIDILRLLAKLAERLRVRVLIGKNDRIIPASLAFNLPSGIAVHFLSAGHMPQWDALPETLFLLTEAVHG
ncbi:MAG: acetoin dehydrogenase dihydrolipoyllysine-residue acetyltransferase subunit [Parvibaculaceae bacterium]